MRSLLIAILILASLTIHAQDWELINPGYKYHYRTKNSNLITSTVWVDSLQDQTKESRLYLNRILTDCDTCPPWFNETPKYALYDAPQFLQRTLTKSGSDYIFQSPDTFLIRPKAFEPWLFDTLNNITAELLSSDEVPVLGQMDSIRIIGLSTEDTIILSKNFGIIRFDAVYTDSSYLLAGIDGVIGKSVPGFEDFFDFTVGDIFEYQGDYFGAGMKNTLYFIEKAFIKEKSQSGNTIEYQVRVKKYKRVKSLPEYLWYSPEYASYDEYSTTWTFINRTDHPTNRYNNQLINTKSYADDRWNCSEYDYTTLHASADSLGIYTKTLGSFELLDFFFIKDTAERVLSRFNGLCDEHEVVYKVGLGEVKHDVLQFEWTSHYELTAYKKGNDTIGVLTDDSELIVGQTLFEEERIIVYPNPANDYIVVETPANKQDRNISLFGLDGKLYQTGNRSETLSLAGLKPGLYILRIDLQDRSVYKKILKSH